MYGEGMKSVQNPAQYVSSLGLVYVCLRSLHIPPAGCEGVGDASGDTEI